MASTLKVRQAVFIHVPRTAGKSMERVFRKLQDQKMLTYQDLGFPLRPKCDSSVDITNTQHLSIQSLIDRGVFTDEWFDSCFKFAFVRNPWDRLVSLYEHLQYRLRRQKRKRPSNDFLHTFEDFANAVCAGMYVKPLGRLVTDDWSQANPQVEWFRWGVDFIGRYETLYMDWPKVLNELFASDIFVHFPLEHHNKSSKSKHYRCYYDRKLAQLVGDFYQEDVDRFGYTF